MADNGILTHDLWLPNRREAHTYVLIKAPTSLLYNMSAQMSVRHRQNQEKEKNYRIEYFHCQIFFWRKTFKMSPELRLHSISPTARAIS